MRALLQRVICAKVEVEGRSVGQIGHGLLILVCALRGDTTVQADRLAGKIARLRIFNDETGKMNRSILQTGGEALIVSQFTLAADTSRGLRPSFSTAAGASNGERLYLHFIDALRAETIRVQTGLFGADMAVSLTNDGPVTVWMDTDA
ncbi:MAG: D-aminoacyl-tRNA deacylase [Pseudomonadota bacterium]